MLLRCKLFFLLWSFRLVLYARGLTHFVALSFYLNEFSFGCSLLVWFLLSGDFKWLLGSWEVRLFAWSTLKWHDASVYRGWFFLRNLYRNGNLVTQTLPVLYIHLIEVKQSHFVVKLLFGYFFSVKVNLLFCELNLSHCEMFCFH